MKPTEPQLAVLHAAASHPQRKLIDFPDNLKGGARAKVLGALINAKWIEASPSNPDAYVITPRGLQVIGIKPVSPMKHRSGTKQAILIDLLKRPEGASLTQMIHATNWQSHTVRGAMAGALKKKLGLEITSDKQPDGERIYRITTT